MSIFKKASKSQAKLRLALAGPAGSGKTFSALRIAKGLGGRIAVIDSEHGSASKYADRFDFDTVSLTTFSPEVYMKAIKAAESEGFDVIVIDSLSHAWVGKDGAIEQQENAQARQKGGNSFTAWKDVTPMQNALMDAIIQSKCHVIATMRTKTEYVMEVVNGKQVPKKVGLAPVQRKGVEYEFDVVGDMDESQLVVTKSRCPDLTKAVVREPGEELGQTLRAWLSDGAAPEVKAPVVAFGVFKGAHVDHVIANGDLEKLREDVMKAEDWLSKNEGHKGIPALTANLAALAPYLAPVSE